MATYVIVASDADPLGPGEIRAGTTIDASAGDIFIIDPSADDDITFAAGSGGTVNFQVVFNASNPNDFSIEFNTRLAPEVTLANGVDASDIDLDATDAHALTLTAGDNVSLGGIDGSKTGDDTIVIGNNFTTDQDITTQGGADSITIGDNATIASIDTGNGTDTISIGDNLTADDIETGKADDAVVLGDNATIAELDTDKGDDTVVVGDNFTAETVDLDKGDDVITIGTGASIDDIDGGKGTDTLYSGTDLPQAENFENVICFGHGTLIRTASGTRPIEQIRTGDAVWTEDHGLQQVLWIGATTVAATGALAPVHIPRGALGNARDLIVSQQHRMICDDWKAEVLFGETQVLVPAKHLIGQRGITLRTGGEVTYFHMLFASHQIVFAEGIPTESFHPGQVGLCSMAQSAQREVFALFPQLLQYPDLYGPAARRSLKSFEARLLAA